ncbi:MAG: serine/threonine protein kinase [Deltaproteobacteria bacterium]
MVGKEIGPYRILEKIGQGGMGLVYKGVHAKLEQEVAIKVLSPEYTNDESMRARFIQEAKIQVKLSHPNVVNILNYLEDGRDIFLVMEYVKGETLESQLKKSGRMALQKASAVCLSVLEALSFMHSRGVIHRDIKPSNIMFTEDGAVKVTDFGIAKVKGEKGQTKTGMRIGTLWYMSPEQIKGQEADMASDIYSLGITFYQMVTGRVPFTGNSEYTVMKGHLEQQPPAPWDINKSVSREFGGVILKSIAKEPKGRYATAREFSGDLRAALKDGEAAEVTAVAHPRASRILPSFELNRKQSLAVLAGLGIILMLIIAFMLKGEDREEGASFPLTAVSPSDAVSKDNASVAGDGDSPDAKSAALDATGEPSPVAEPKAEPLKEEPGGTAVSELPAAEDAAEPATGETPAPKKAAQKRDGGWKIKK